MFSGNLKLGQFIRETLPQLQEHQGLFHDLGQEGEVVLRIGWFSDTNHSATCLDVDVLKLCSDLGLGIELNFYAPDES